MFSGKETRFHGFPRFKEDDWLERPVSLKRNLIITVERIPEAALVSGRTMSMAMGAAVYFVGVVRAHENGKSIQAIEYEAFKRMVEHQFGILFDEVENRWPIESVHLIHRIGRVAVN